MNDHNGQLKSYVERIQNLEEQIKALQDDKKDLFKEAAGNGFDGPALKATVKIRMEDPKKRQKRLSKE